MRRLFFSLFSCVVLFIIYFFVSTTSVYATDADCINVGAVCVIGGTCLTSKGTIYKSIGCDRVREECCLAAGSSGTAVCYANGGVCAPGTSCSGVTDFRGRLHPISIWPPCQGSVVAGSGGEPVFIAGGQACCALAPPSSGGGGGGPPPPPPTYNISGTVWNDTNRDGDLNNGESVMSGVVIVMGGKATGSRTTNSSGNFSFNFYRAGTYTLTVSLPSGFVNTSALRRTVTIGPNASGISFAIVNIYSISGNVFNDINKNRLKDTNSGVLEPNISGIAINSSGGSLTTNSAAGTYSITNLFQGTYTISYDTNTTPIPNGYFLIYPLNGPPPQLRLSVGPNCTRDIGLSFGASCINGSIQNANFAISNSIPWLQSYGLDMRIDEGFEDKIPANPLYPPYASVADTANATILSPVLVSQGTLPSQNAGGPAKVYVNNLTVGARYKIVVSGTYYYQVHTNDSLTDPQWDDWLQTHNCFCRRINKVVFNGVAPDASDYQSSVSPSHTYSYIWTADSPTLEMYIPDGAPYYSDNSGSFSYKLYTYY